MILVTLGTQDKPFTRLIQFIEDLKSSGKIADEVIVQSGFTPFSSNHLNVQAYYSQIELDALRDKADLIITHAGVGSILDALKYHKKVIAVARLKHYGEHTNDHQLELLEAFEFEGYILRCDDLSKLSEVIEKAKNFKPKAYPFDPSAVLKTVLDAINQA
jgi:UDP-N-acetylglucosamine transferase subunit ALG13